MFNAKGALPHLARMKNQNIVIGVCLVLGLVLVSFFTPIYDVTEIEVIGNEHNDAQTVIGASGIRVGENIFKISVSDAKKGVSKVAFVDTVSINRSLPNKVKITVTESVEAAYISFIGNYIGIDENGKILEIRQQSDVDKPLIYGLHIDNFEIGTKVILGDENTQNVLNDILSQIKSSNLTDKILSVDINDEENIIMVMRSGIEVKLGNGDSLKYKIAYLKSVLDELGDATGGVINLSDTENVTYRAE